jgi:hypothetical protein
MTICTQELRPAKLEPARVHGIRLNFKLTNPQKWKTDRTVIEFHLAG